MEDTELDINPINFNYDAIKMRQHYYFLGRKAAQVNDYQSAIDAYSQYSEWLEKEDQHIPHQWIAKFYTKLNNDNLALSHLNRFAKGCKGKQAADVFKEIGQKYEEMKQPEEALTAYKNAVKVYPQIGLKSKIEQLEKN